MRIDSMDASSITNINIQKPKVEQRNVQINSEVDKIALDSKNIANLSNFEKKELPLSEKIVINAIERANKAISGANRRFEFSIHEQTKEIMIKVINSETNEIIREIPNEKILDMVAKMWEMAGIVVDERR